MSTFARGAFNVVPSDSVDLPGVTSAGLWIGTTGSLTITLVTGATASFASIPVGLFPVLVRKVWSTGTTASNMVGLQL